MSTIMTRPTEQRSAKVRADGSDVTWQYVDGVQSIALVGRRDGKACGIITHRPGEGYLVAATRSAYQAVFPELDDAMRALG